MTPCTRKIVTTHRMTVTLMLSILSNISTTRCLNQIPTTQRRKSVAQLQTSRPRPIAIVDPRRIPVVITRKSMTSSRRENRRVRTPFLQILLIVRQFFSFHYLYQIDLHVTGEVNFIELFIVQTNLSFFSV